VFRRGQHIVLQDIETKEKVTVTVVMHDTMQGILAINKEDVYTWYREESNAEHGWPGPYYTCIKRVVKKRKKKRK